MPKPFCWGAGRLYHIILRLFMLTMSCLQMFVAKSERGRGLGDVLLFETLNRRCKTFPRSHLYVSSRNTTAVAIYHKFGFVQSNKPSGDISHDLVREFHCCTP